MPLIITMGLGTVGDGSKSALINTMGLGMATVDQPGCLALTILAVENFGTYLRLIMSQDMALAGIALDPTKWVITSPTGVEVTVDSVSQSAHVITLNCTEQTQGATYTIDPPDAGVIDTFGNELADGTTVDFTGMYVAIPFVVLTRAVDERTMDVIYSEPVVQEDAETPTNYSFAPPLAVLTATRLTSVHYRLTTGPQTLTGSYALTVTNVRDLAHNPVA